MSGWPHQRGLGTLCTCSMCSHFKAQDLRGLSPEALAAVAEQMLAHIGEQSKHIGEQEQAHRLAGAGHQVA